MLHEYVLFSNIMYMNPTVNTIYVNISLMSFLLFPMTPREWNWMGCINIGLCWSCKYHKEKYSKPYHMLVRGDTNIDLVRTFREETTLDEWSVDGKVWAGFILLMQNVFVIMSFRHVWSSLTLHLNWMSSHHEKTLKSVSLTCEAVCSVGLSSVL